MPESSHHDRPRITLEQLLALKRSERPEPAFWEDFDRELHRRQLASVVTRPAWYVRAARLGWTGLRRAAPVAAASAAAVVGFLVLQPAEEAAAPTAAVAASDANRAEPVVEQDAPAVVRADVAVRLPTPERAMPVFERPVTSEARFSVHEFVATTAPARTFVSVNSPNSFSSPAYEAGVQMVNTLTSGAATRGGAVHEAGRF